jgi:hypothetical protein
VSSKKKNNHFVPRSYLRQFCSASKQQIALYNIKSGIFALEAPIKSQCSRDYFYTKNPKFEDRFRAIEDQQKELFDNIIATNQIPALGSRDRSDLSACTIFQAGRTATTVAAADHVVNEFGKAYLHHHLTREGNTELLKYLPDLKMRTIDVVIDRIADHILMYPLIDDLDCTLLINQTAEDFLTRDHPVALCNSLPLVQNTKRYVGFASRGLIILYPISPRALLFFSDPAVYRIVNVGRGQPLYKQRDVVELNLLQFGNAYENVYFANVDRVQRTLEAFRKRAATVRPPVPPLSQTKIETANRHGVLLSMQPPVPRLPLPKPASIRHAAKTGKYQTGDGLIRDHVRTAVVRTEMERQHKLREEATKRARRKTSESREGTSGRVVPGT